MPAPLDLVVEPAAFMQAPGNDACTLIHISSEGVYNSGHVPGALYLPPQALLRGQPPVPGKLPELDQLQQVFSYLGHTPDTHYVV